MSEMDKLENYLKNNNYNYKRLSRHGGEQIMVFDSDGNAAWDVVCHRYSYGHEKGLLEAAGSIVLKLFDEVEGYLTADEIISRLEAFII